MRESVSIAGTGEQELSEDGVDPRHARLLVCAEDIQEAHYVEEFGVQLWDWDSDETNHQQSKVS